MNNIFLNLISLFYSNNRRLKLMDNNEYEKFIIQQKEAINREKSEKNKHLLILNLSVAYFHNNQSHEAIELLENLTLDDLSDSSKPIYYCNLLSYYIGIRNKEMVDKIFVEGQFYLQQLKKMSEEAYDFKFAEYYIYKAMWKESNELLSKINYKKLHGKVKISYDLLRVAVYTETDKIGEARKLIEQLSKKQLSPRNKILVDNFRKDFC